MKILTQFVTTLMLVAVTHVHADVIQAPLGLTWGMTQAQAKSSGIRLSNCQRVQGYTYTLCFTKNPPKPVSLGKFYGLEFFPGRGLQGVNISGKHITKDFNGGEGKKRYAALKDYFTAEYGAPIIESEDVAGGDEFYECLADGCGVWRTVWRPDRWGILLSLEGVKRGEGYVWIGFTTKVYAEILNSSE